MLRSKFKGQFGKTGTVYLGDQHFCGGERHTTRRPRVTWQQLDTQQLLPSLLQLSLGVN